jgi:ribosome-binding protein aMBF1 (putative translation factor)
MVSNMAMMINGVKHTTFEDLWERSNLTQAEKDEIQLKIDFAGKLIEAREQKGISQKRLAEMAGLKQPAIARLERMQATPQLDTLFKVLKPLGYTLAIVPDAPPPSASLPSANP